MAQNYYFLVSGLNEYLLDSDTKGLDLSVLRQDIEEQISYSDRKSLYMLGAFYDVSNIINSFQGRDNMFSELGNLSKGYILEIKEWFYEDTASQIELSVPPKGAPKFIEDVLVLYKNPHILDEDQQSKIAVPMEKSLWENFYKNALGSKCEFLRKWYMFDRDVRNISAAHTARIKNLDIAEYVIGCGEIADSLKSNNSPDFGLNAEVDYMEELLQILDNKDIMSKERKLDVLRWNCIDDISTFDYFNIDAILAYLAKLNIIYRWMSLDAKIGKQMFDRLLGNLTDKKLLDLESIQ